MGFLDRMLAGAIEQSTGFKARGLVRAIGSRRLLTLGGAALAGGMLAQSAQQGGFRGSRSPSGGTGTVVPPSSNRPTPGAPAATPPPPVSSLPPVPGAAPAEMPPLPSTPSSDVRAPLPPLPGEPPEEGDAQFQVVALRTVVAAALADGEIAAEERGLLQEHLSSSDLPETDRQRIQGDLLAPAAPAALAADYPAGEDPTALVALAIAMLRSDGEMVASERAWLGELASALGVPADRVTQIEGELFEA